MNSWFSRKNAKTESTPAQPRRPTTGSTARPKKKPEPFITRRWIIFFLFSGIWLLLAAWTISAFFEHIDTLNPSYKLGAYAGACVGEFAGLWFLYLKSFDHSLTLRRWALILSIALAIVLIVHSGALIGMKEGAQAQAETENVLTEKLGQLSQKQMGAVGDGKKAEALTPRQQRAQARSESRLKGDIAKNAQKELADTVKGRQESIRESGIFPAWYFKGWMYIVIFVCVLIFSGILAAISHYADVTDIDSNFDGVPDIQEGGIVEHKGKSYALDPYTGEASEEYAAYLKKLESQNDDFLKWREEEEGRFKQIRESSDARLKKLWAPITPEEKEQMSQQIRERGPYAGSEDMTPEERKDYQRARYQGILEKDGLHDAEVEMKRMKAVNRSRGYENPEEWNQESPHPNRDSHGRTYTNSPLGPVYDEGQITIEKAEPARKQDDQEEPRQPSRRPIPVAKWKGNTLQNPEDFSESELRVLSDSTRQNGQNGHGPK